MEIFIPDIYDLVHEIFCKPYNFSLENTFKLPPKPGIRRPLPPDDLKIR